MKPTLFNIFKAFFKIGLILLGGGYVIVPIMNEELVKKRGWLTSDEVFDYYCVAQCLPGIIAINISILVGNKLKRIKGAITAVFAVALSPIISIIVIAKLLSLIIKIPFIESVFWGVNLSVIVLLYLALKEMWTKSIVDKLTTLWFLIILTLGILKINPVYLIISSVVFGFLLELFNKKGDENG